MVSLSGHKQFRVSTCHSFLSMAEYWEPASAAGPSAAESSSWDQMPELTFEQSEQLLADGRKVLNRRLAMHLQQEAQIGNQKLLVFFGRQIDWATIASVAF